MKFLFRHSNLQSGQTLIETLAAIFILTMGVTAATGLAIYAYSSSGSITEQIVATGLAREGIEAVRNMRDTNWLAGSLSTSCYNFTSSPVGLNTASCYPNWLNTNFNITAGTYLLRFDPTTEGLWSLTAIAGSNGYGLDSDANVNDDKGFYYHPAVPVADGTSPYYRAIVISVQNSSGAFGTNVGPEMLVKSQVWWTDKKCPRSQTWPGPGNCSVELDTFLTNWKNY